MEEPASEAERNLDTITAEHAVLIPALQNVKSVIAYVEAVAVVIGSCHIHSVYESGDQVKVYLNDKRFVDILVNNGVTILGRRMNVDYAVPRADKVVLSNVDPIVPDAILMKLLCYYGSPVSSIIHEKIATNSEYSHIECGRRKIYMNIFPHKKMPPKVNFTYLDVCYRIDIIVETCNNDASGDASVISDVDRVMDVNEELIEVESNQSVKPNINELMPLRAKQPTPKQLAYFNRGKQTMAPTSAAKAVKRLKKRARGGWYAAKVKKMKRMNSTTKPSPTKQGRAKRLASSTAASGIRKISKIGRRKAKVAASDKSVVDGNMELPLPVEVNGDLNGFVEQGSITNALSSEKVDTRSVSQYPLSVEDLEKFMFKTRFHREPVQVAMEFLSHNKTPEALSALKTQLLEYHNVCKDFALKLRIKRLVSALKISTEAAD